MTCVISGVVVGVGKLSVESLLFSRCFVETPCLFNYKPLLSAVCITPRAGSGSCGFFC